MKLHGLHELDEKQLKFLRKAETRLIENDGETVYWSVGQDRFPVGLYAIVYPEGYLYNFGEGLVSHDTDVNEDYNFKIGYNSKGEILFVRVNQTEETAFLEGRYYSKKNTPQKGEFFFVFVTFGRYTELFCLHGDIGLKYVYRLASKKEAQMLLQEISLMLPAFNSTVSEKFSELLKEVKIDD